MNTRVNYDNISPVYNERYKQSELEGVENFLKKIFLSHKAVNVLEAGCGTAYWLNRFSGFNCKLFGVDFSKEMLKIAQASNKNIHLLNADAVSLPFKKNSFDMIYALNAIHHFGNWEKFISDSFQLLKQNGIFLIIGLEPRESKCDWYMYKYFEKTYQIDICRFPTFFEIENVMRHSGFNSFRKKLVHKIDIFKKGREVLKDHFITQKGASQLALLSDEEYRLGISRIEYDIEQAELTNKEIIFETKLNFYASMGIKHI